MAGISKEASGMNRHHRISDVKIEKGVLSLVVDGNAIQRNLTDLSISPSGYGIYWPLIDEDISVDGLLGIEHHPHSDRKSA